MPSRDVLEPLAPDACRSDRSASCAYWHTKTRALGGKHLSQELLDFVGFYSTRSSTDGWRYPTLVDQYESASVLFAEDSAMLSQLMNVGGESALEFLG